MKKIYFFLVMALFAITSSVTAQEATETVTEWDGSQMTVNIAAGSSKTFSYIATANGQLNIIAPTGSSNLVVNIQGGLYSEGAITKAFDVAEPYDNGKGVYASVNVVSGDVVRFTLSAPAADGDGSVSETSLILQTKIFAEDFGGKSVDNPIAISTSKAVEIPAYVKTSTDLPEYNTLTYLSFVAPVTGVMDIVTTNYIIYYIEKEKYGKEDLKYSYYTGYDDSHEFVTEKGKEYIVLVPNTRPVSLSMRVVSDRIGENCTYPTEITSFPATLSLAKGNNWFKMSMNNLEAKEILEIATKAGWTGNIQYWNDCDVANTWLTTDDVNNEAKTITKNINPTRLETYGQLYFNIVSTDGDAADALTLSLREPNEGEACCTATPIQLGENKFTGNGREQWFSYTGTKEAEMSVATSGLKYISTDCDDTNSRLSENIYRISEGATYLFCIVTEAGAENTITISEKEITAGDYCDYPIDFALGQDITIADRGDYAMNYRRFTAEESGKAVFTTNDPTWLETRWSVVFRNDCEGKALDYVAEEFEDENTGDLALSYTISVTKGETYIIEITSFANSSKDVIVKSAFETASAGSNCETAIAIEELGTEIAFDNTPDMTLWYTYTADKTGFYTIKSKIGRGSTMKTMIGDCNATLVNSTSDNSMNNAYMAGYKVSKIYVEEGTPFFVCITMSSDPGDTDGTNRYIIASFAEARPGEYFGSPIQAVAGTTYYLPNTDDAYDTWYTYTIPAGTECIFNIGSDITPSYGSLAFYSDETTTMSAYKGDFTQTNNKNANNQMCGKTYTFAAGETDRIVYIKTSYQKNLHWWNITLDSGESINDINAENSMILYPNPTDGTFYVNVPTVENGTKITVTTLTGKVVYNASISSNVTNVTLNTTGGIYLVTVSNGNSVETAKLIVK